MATPVTVTLESGDWDVIQGFVTGEWSKVRLDKDRAPYTENLGKIRRAISEAQERQEGRKA
jgi:hypothetical protein